VGGIPTIQAFSISIAGGSKTGTATISAVDMSRSVIMLSGYNGANDSSTPMHAVLTNTTTVTATKTFTTGSTVVLKGFVLTYPVGIIKSIQRGIIPMTNAQTSRSTTVTSVNTAKSVLSHLGQITDLTNTGSGTTNALASSNAHIALTSATNIDAVRTATASSGGTPANNTCDISYELIEFN
jgi:alanine racemase